MTPSGSPGGVFSVGCLFRIPFFQETAKARVRDLIGGIEGEVACDRG